MANNVVPLHPHGENTATFTVDVQITSCNKDFDFETWMSEWGNRILASPDDALLKRDFLLQALINKDLNVHIHDIVLLI